MEVFWWGGQLSLREKRISSPVLPFDIRFLIVMVIIFIKPMNGVPKGNRTLVTASTERGSTIEL